MKAFIRNLRIVFYIFILLSVSLLTGLFIQQRRSQRELSVAAGENKESLRTRYANAGRILDRNDIILAQSEDGNRMYCEDPEIARALLHIVGDYTHNMTNTIESRYQNVLLGTSRNLATQLFLDVQGKGLRGDNVVLTVDAELCKKAYSYLEGRKGSVVLLNYKTGEILVSVSAPSASPESVIQYQDIPDSGLFNRSLSGLYAPGSTFKIVTSAAWLTSSIYDPEFSVDCQAVSTVDPYGANESGNAHGHVNLSSAFSQSCNIFFGQIGAGMGKDTLVRTALNMGYGMDMSADSLLVQTSKISTSDNPSTLSWLSIGQPAESELYMTPLQMASMAGSIGNDGSMVNPHIIKYLSTPSGFSYQNITVNEKTRTMDAFVAAQLESLMILSTTSGTGTASAVSGYTVASKTGTVQVEGHENNALTVAYIVEDAMPYAVAVIVEEGGSGGGTAAPIAGRILSDTVSLTR